MKKFISVILCLIMVISVAVNVAAADIVVDTAKYLLDTVDNPTIGTIGGEWTILALSRSECDISSEYYETYYRNVEKYVRECSGVLHKRKYTEYSRVILALTAIGKDPKNVAGYNLLMPLGDYEMTLKQGINGAIWALIALDCNNYPIPQNPDAKVQATREMYTEKILSSQLADGGWALGNQGESDPDITAMALVALSGYRADTDVCDAIEKALRYLSRIQSDDGGFGGGGEANIESSAQVLVAMCELDIPIDDERFVKNGNAVIDNIRMYYQTGAGFRHTLSDSDTDVMSTEQALCAMVALERSSEGKTTFYDMRNSFVASGESVFRIQPIYNSIVQILTRAIVGED